MKKILFALFFVLALTEIATAQSFLARVNRSEVPEGETFMLTLELDNADVKETPDLTVLDKDFIVYSVSNAYRTNIINGTVSRMFQWNLVLMPKKSGNLTIPPIKLGQYQSNPVSLKVFAAGDNISPASSQNPNQPRFKIEAQVDNKSPYVQQQVNYTLTLYDTGGLQGEEPVFEDNAQSNWIIKSLGEPQITNTVIDGQNIRKITFRYAFFPQKSGSLEIPAARFNGFYLSREKRNNPFDNIFSDDLFIAGFGMTDVFAARNPVALTAKPILISVQPAAQENNGKWWFPASDVTLAAEFNPAQPRFKVGEAVNRTIYLKAAGVADTQLPTIHFPDSPGMKQYPEKPETQMKVENGKVVSLKKISNVYIPTQSGQIQLPPISVDWFNVNTHKMEKAQLPAITINVLPDDNAPLPQTTPKASAAPLTTEQSSSPKITEQISNGKIFLFSGGAFALGILFCWLLMKLFKRTSPGKVRNYKKYVIEKARIKDLRGVRDGLLGWAADFYEKANITSLREIEDLNNTPEFGCELEKLSEALYANQQQDWKSGNFIKAFEKVSRQKKAKGKKDELLPKLYR